MRADIKKAITDEYSKVPARLKDNFLVRGAINSLNDSLTDEEVLEQLQLINKNARRKAPMKPIVFPELKTGLEPFVRATGKKSTSPIKRRKAK